MQLAINPKIAILLGILLAFPTAYFITISVLKYGLGEPYFYDSAEPLLQQMGLREPPGFNINLLILLGPVVALLINIIAVLKFKFENSKHDFSIKFSIQKHWWNMALIIFSGLLMTALFIYAAGENCRC